MSGIDDYLKEHGFIIPSNEIYGGYRGLYDYGNLGVLLKKNIQRLWEEFFVLSEENVYFLEGSILGSEACWRASGHLENFNDVLVDCLTCKRRYREDHLVNRECPGCGGKKWTEPRDFNLIFKVQQENLYLRPETAQGIFMNFKNIQRITLGKIPFAIAQVGKAFRNEITMHNSIFRTLEFEQMECEWFTEEGESNLCYSRCLKQMQEFLVDVLGISRDLIKVMEIPEQDRAHYSRGSTDILFKYESGWGELWGLANRGDYDLRAHQESSGKSMEYLKQSEEGNYKFIPHVVEHSVGLNRLMYALVSSCLEVQEERTVLKLKPDLAPYKYAIMPLTKEEYELAEKIYRDMVKRRIRVLLFKKGSIGKRYKKCDAIGVPWCVTVDKNSCLKGEVTVRDRDTTKQICVNWKEIV